MFRGKKNRMTPFGGVVVVVVVVDVGAGKV